MDFKLSKELEMLRKAVREFANKKIAPNADEWDEQHYFPYKEVILPMGELGFFGTVIPEEYDGVDMGWLAAMIVTEEIARASSSLRVQINMQTLGCAYTILRYGEEEVKEKYVAKLATAEYVGGFGITEPDAGSDVMAMSSTAEDKGDHWLINGSKTYITNGTRADFVTLMVKTDPDAGHSGISIIMCPTDVKGFSVSKKLEKAGNWSSDTAELFFEDLRVPAKNLIGPENGGFMVLMQNFAGERLMLAASAVAIAFLGLYVVVPQWVVSTAPERHVNQSLIHSLKNLGYAGRIAVTAHSPAEAAKLEKAGADLVMVPYADAAREAADRLLFHGAEK